MCQCRAATTGRERRPASARSSSSFERPGFGSYFGDQTSSNTERCPAIEPIVKDCCWRAPLRNPFFRTEGAEADGLVLFEHRHNHTCRGTPMAARRAALSGLGLVLANLSTAQNTTPLAVLKQAFGLSEHTIGRRVEPVDRLAARAELAAARHPSSASRGAVGATVPCTPFERVPHNYMLEHESFLPPRSAGVSSGVPSACPPDAAAAELRAHLLALGHPRRCAAAAQVTADNVGYGIGSVINAWVKVLDTRPYLTATTY